MGTRAATVLLCLAASCLSTFVAGQDTQVVPSIPLENGVSGRVLTAAQFIIGQKSWNYNALPVTYRRTYCLGSGREPCALGNRASVACTPGNKVYLLFNVTADVEGEQIPVTSFQNTNEYNFQCGGNITLCIPKVNSYVVGNFSNRMDAMQSDISNCTNDEPSVIICTSENTMGGTMAGLCGFWASQNFPTAQITVITFASNWPTQVNLAFGVQYGRFVQKTLNMSRTAEEVTGSTLIRSSETWVISGSECGNSTYCKGIQAINASCLLEADIEGNQQFLEGYPGAVVLYGFGQTAAVMWVSEASAAYFVFSNQTAPELYSRSSFSNMVPLFDPNTLRLPDAYYQVYKDFFADTDVNPDPDSKFTVEPMVVSDYVNSFWAFDDVQSSKRQCKGLLGCFNFISASATPQQIICAGQGVAGGVATFCGAWATLQFPGASVATFNAGSPQPVGNIAFSRFLRSASGAFYNYVNNLDPIPRLVACDNGDNTLVVPGVTTFYFNNTATLQARDQHFSMVNCSQIVSKDSECSSYLSEAIESDPVKLPINLPIQQPHYDYSDSTPQSLQSSYDLSVLQNFA